MSSSERHALLVLISGNGTNLQALIDATTQPSASNYLANARIARVISNRKAAFGLIRAKEANIPTTYHNLVPYKSKHPATQEGLRQAREAYDRDLAQLIVTNTPKPSLVVCAGWMHVLDAAFVSTLHDAGVSIINLHPALPGQFNGADAIARAWQAFQRGEIASTGVMVHHVISEVDAGQVIATEDVECRVEEPQTELEARIHKVEWELIVKGTRLALKEIDEKKRS